MGGFPTHPPDGGGMSGRCLFNLHRWSQYGEPATLAEHTRGARIAVTSTETDSHLPVFQKRQCQSCGLIDLRSFTFTKEAPPSVPMHRTELRYHIRALTALMLSVSMFLCGHDTEGVTRGLFLLAASVFMASFLWFDSRAQKVEDAQ